MFLRLIKRAIRSNAKLPYGKCFVSFAYNDEPVLDQLRERLVSCANLFEFPPIQVLPEQMVSNDLLRSIRKCDSLIYLKGGQSAISPWVALERDYALRSKMDVYFFNQENGTIGKDTSSPLDLHVFASYSSVDGKRVMDLLNFMHRKRSFDIQMDEDYVGVEYNEKLNQLIKSKLGTGGYFVLFWSSNASKSPWIRDEMKRAFELYPGRIMPALMEPVELPIKLQDLKPVRLYRKDRNEIDKRRLDDLIVRLYWLIYQGMTEHWL